MFNLQTIPGSGACMWPEKHKRSFFIRPSLFTHWPSINYKHVFSIVSSMRKYCKKHFNEKKNASHGNRGRTQMDVRVSCPTIGSLFFSAPLGIHSSSRKGNRSVFLNGQIWHCPITPARVSTNENIVSTSTRCCRPQRNYGMVLMCRSEPQT